MAETIVADQLEHDPHHPFTKAEINKTVESVWKMETEGHNWLGQEPRVQFSHAELGVLCPFPQALSLLSILRMAHGVRAEPFSVSPKGMQSANMIPGWGRSRYTNARNILLELGYLVQVHHGGSRPGDASKFILPRHQR